MGGNQLHDSCVDQKSENVTRLSSDRARHALLPHNGHLDHWQGHRPTPVRHGSNYDCGRDLLRSEGLLLFNIIRLNVVILRVTSDISLFNVNRRLWFILPVPGSQARMNMRPRQSSFYELPQRNGRDKVSWSEMGSGRYPRFSQTAHMADDGQDKFNGSEMPSGRTRNPQTPQAAANRSYAWFGDSYDWFDEPMRPGRESMRPRAKTRDSRYFSMYRQSRMSLTALPRVTSRMWQAYDEDNYRFEARNKPVVETRNYPISKTKTILIMIAFAMAGFLTGLDSVIVSNALPDIEKDMHLSGTMYAWIGSSYLLSGASLLPLWGPISDIVGRKWPMAVGMAIFAAGNFIAARANDAITLLVGRATQGVGGFCYVVLLNIALADLFCLRDRGPYLALYGLATALGAALAPILSGILTQYAGWRWCFWVPLPLACTIVVLTAVLFPSEIPKNRPGFKALIKLDWPGVFLITGATVTLLLGLQFGGISHPWKSALVLSLLLAGPALFGVFVVQQRFMPRPIMPLRLFQDRSRIACFVVCFSHGFVYIGTIYYLPIYFNIVLDASPVDAGLWLLATALPCGFFSVLIAWSVKKTGQYTVAISMSVAMLALSVGLFINFPIYRSWVRIVVFQLILSVGIGSLLQVPLLAIQTSLRAEEITAANAVFVFMRTIASAISIVAAQVVLQNGIKNRVHEMLASGLPAALVEQLPKQLSLFKATHGASAAQQHLLKQVLTKSLSEVWMLYTAVAGFGFLASLFIRAEPLWEKLPE